MNRNFKIAFLVLFFALTALPTAWLFGVKDIGPGLWGAEKIPAKPGFTFGGVLDRSYQNVFTEHFSKTFYHRRVFFRTSRQLREYTNFGLFHYGGYAGGTIEGKPCDASGVGMIFEDPYAKYHLECERPFNPKKYGRVIALLKEIDEFCRTNGADFVFQSVPDKLQTYPEFLPDWMGWVWNYSNFPIQTHMAALCNANGVKAVDGLEVFAGLKASTNVWIYPPGGTHLTSFASAKLENEIVRRVNAAGRIHLEENPLVGVEERPKGEWSVDNDISELLNIWFNDHVKANVHLFPEFERTNVVMNAGSAFIIGDCYREQMEKIFGESGLFARDRIRISKRKGQKPEDFREIIGDLKLVVLTFQSFNSGQLDERYDELKTIFDAMRTARAAKGEEK